MAVDMTLLKTETLVTGDDLLAMGDTGRCELVEGWSGWPIRAHVSSTPTGPSRTGVSLRRPMH